MIGDNPTPGPWHVELARGQSRLAIDDSRGLEIALLTRPHGTTNADARLIAAAPDMFDALREFAACDLVQITRFYNDRGQAAPASIFYARELARAAIAKAEGR